MSVVLTEELIRVALGDRDRPLQKELADEREPGLRLQLAAREASWSVIARTQDGTRARIPMGPWPAISLDQARLVARSIKATYQGGTESDGRFTVAQLLDRHRTRRLNQLRTAKVVERALALALAPIKHREAASVSRRDLAEIIDDIAERTPIQANRVLAYTKSFFKWAVGRGYLDTSPAAAISKPAREVTRERTPGLPELAEIWVAADGLGYPFGPILKLLMLSAMRREEIGAMRASELDLPAESDEGVWTLPANRSKNGRAIRVPLAPLAREVLEEALKVRPKGADFVFTTTSETPVSGWSNSKLRLDAAILKARRQGGGRTPHMEHWRIHDLRRSFATTACDVLKIDPAVADRCLNHVGASTTSTVSRVYARNEMFEQRREALNAWAVLIAEAVRERAAAGSETRRPGRGRQVKRRARTAVRQ